MAYSMFGTHHSQAFFVGLDTLTRTLGNDFLQIKMVVEERDAFFMFHICDIYLT
jgi:hypothetical protein